MDFLKDLILDDQNLLSLDYHSRRGFQISFQMYSFTFEEILNMITPRMTRKLDTRLRNAIPIHKKLACTYKFLTSGDLYHFPQYQLSKQCCLIRNKKKNNAQQWEIISKCKEEWKCRIKTWEIKSWFISTSCNDTIHAIQFTVLRLTNGWSQISVE